jgi:hypothetical protein
MSSRIVIFADKGMVVQSYRLLSPKHGQEIAITSYFKVAKMTLVSTASMRVAALNRDFGSAT